MSAELSITRIFLLSLSENMAMSTGAIISPSIITGMRSVVMMKLFLVTRSIYSRLIIMEIFESIAFQVLLLIVGIYCLNENVIHRCYGFVDSREPYGFIRKGDKLFKTGLRFQSDIRTITAIRRIGERNR